jgi:hypothetical protein
MGFYVIVLFEILIRCSLKFKREDVILMSDEILSKSESIIRQATRKFLDKIDGYDFEDLMQIGRVLVWQLINEKNISDDNFESFSGYLYKALIYSYNNDYKKSKAKKRIRLSETTSLDKVVSFDDERSLYEVIPTKNDDGDITLETLDFIKNAAIKSKDPKAIKGVVHCLIELLGILPEEISTKINYYTFVRYRLQYYLWIFFNNSPYRALRFAYPNLNPTDMEKAPNGHWNGKVGKRRAIAILKRTLMESGYEKTDYPLIVNERFIESVGLSAPYQKHFHSSPFAFLDAAFPETFMPWEMAYTPMGYFGKDKELAKKAVRWLVEEKLGILLSDMDEKEVWRQGTSKRVTKEVMEYYGLRGLMSIYGNYPEPLMRLAYPDKFQAWDFKHSSKWQGDAGLELAAKATRWVIEEYAGLQPTSAGIGYKFFIENGLHGMITSRSLGFNSSPKAALKNAYPDLYLIP